MARSCPKPHVRRGSTPGSSLPCGVPLKAGEAYCVKCRCAAPKCRKAQTRMWPYLTVQGRSDLTLQVCCDHLDFARMNGADLSGSKWDNDDFEANNQTDTYGDADL